MKAVVLIPLAILCLQTKDPLDYRKTFTLERITELSRAVKLPGERDMRLAVLDNEQSLAWCRQKFRLPVALNDTVVTTMWHVESDRGEGRYPDMAVLKRTGGRITMKKSYTNADGHRRIVDRDFRILKVADSVLVLEETSVGSRGQVFSFLVKAR